MAATQTDWQEEVKSWVTSAASRVDDFIDIRWRHMKKRFDWEGTPQIQSYLGFGNDGEVWVHGRVLTNPPTGSPSDDDHWWENLARTYQRFASQEVSDCDVAIQFANGAEHSITTDEEGYFFLHRQLELASREETRWAAATARIVGDDRVSEDASHSQVQLLIPGEEARFGVISDVDDTILHTNATNLLTMAKLTFTGNARTRAPLQGVSGLYQALHQQGRNPLFYVSSSPWNLYDLLKDFIELNSLPLGPIFLRDLGFDDNKFIKEGHDHKLDKLDRLFGAYPNLPFVLFGDSGQQDARIYSEAAKRYGDRVAAIFIRDVDPEETTDRDRSVREQINAARGQGVPMHLVQDSVDAAKVAADLDLIDRGDIDAIRRATEADSERASL